MSRGMHLAACLLLAALGTSGCLRRAPTTFELDKRAGNPVPPAAPEYEQPRRKRGRQFDEPMRTTSTISPAPVLPARTAPVIRRVWVADQALPDGSWLQGTWWYIEVEPSRWLYEVDPGSAPFAEPPPEPEDDRKRRRKRGAR